MDILRDSFTMGEWEVLIHNAEVGAMPEPIVNVHEDDDTPFEAIFIGGGAGGRFGSAFLKARGCRQLVVDRWPFLGGSCPHTACVPHHLFSELAREMDYLRWNGGILGFPEFDEKKASILDAIDLFKRGRNNAHAFMNWQSKEQLGMEYILNAAATVIDNHTVEVAGKRYTGRNLVLGTGASTVVPDIPGIGMKGVFDFAGIIDYLDYEPNRCVIIGGSKVALEYGSFYQATGCPTTIVSRSPLMRTASLHHIDEDLRRYVVENMRRRGIDILEGAEPIEILGNGKVTGVRVRTASGEEKVIETDFVFIGTGERANSQPFVDALGVEVDERGSVLVNDRMQTNVPGVYAIGDLIGPPMEMFKARHCGTAAARNISGEDYTWDYSEYPDFLHTTYEVTWVGLSEEEAKAQYGDDVIVIQMPPKGIRDEEICLPLSEGTMLYAFTRPEFTGFQKCLYDSKTRRLLGAHHVGFGAKDSFQYLDYLIKKGFTIDEMGELNELFLNPEHFIQLSRLRAGRSELEDL